MPFDAMSGMRTKLFNSHLRIYFFICLFSNASALIRWNNLRCQSYNENLLNFDYCRIKTVARQVQEISIKLILHNTTINNMSTTMLFKRKSGGYKPYNTFINAVEVDVCAFLRKSNNLIFDAVYKEFGKYSNLNHTCPYNHDIALDRARVDDTLLHWIPFPVGDYAFLFTILLNTARAQVDLFFTYSE